MSADKDLTMCERVYGVMFNIVIPKISHSSYPRVRYSRTPSGNGADRQMNSPKDSPKTGQPEEVKVLREVTIQRSFSGAKERAASIPKSFSAEKEGAVSTPGSSSGERPGKQSPVSIPGSLSGEKPENQSAVSIPGSLSGGKPEKQIAASIPGSLSGGKPEKQSAASIPRSLSGEKPEKQSAVSIPRSFSGEKGRAVSIPKGGEVSIQKSNISDLNAKSPGIGDVNEKADEFIRDFYNQLKRQRPEP